mgnify:CR=1 FL=1
MRSIGENEEKTPNELVMTEIEKRNPYLSYNTEQGVMVSNTLPDVENVLVQTSNNQTFILSRELLERAIHLQQYSCAIKFLCIVDFAMNFLYLYIGYSIALWFMICSIGGYVSTYTYNKKWLLAYLIYQYFQVLTRAIITITLIVLLSDPSLRPGFENTFPDFELPQNYGNSILLSALFLIIQTYITCFVHKFYKLLPNKREHQRFLAESHA